MVLDKWRQWRYKRWETRVATGDDFGKFVKLLDGPWTPEIAARMPIDVLLSGPQFGQIDAQTRRIIDMELERRLRSWQPAISNIIALLALIVAVCAYLKH